MVIVGWPVLLLPLLTNKMSQVYISIKSTFLETARRCAGIIGKETKMHPSDESGSCALAYILYTRSFFWLLPATPLPLPLSLSCCSLSGCLVKRAGH
ncbi:uncharacterized protein F5891DRAFT_1023481 [Suillus fuscotomentosus]|uniref:Secreted protein n=1 Tax=Suillus fuscotomentosus TaxID=1912939 RepID=A0AAD4E9Q6_9AGAM|nr:uncharacterized protein F5891DRAFT_1023481 [Suillus fuscotomentosus]KAG1902320.1 hypothetical protein F5891DRAFT_1023481 [Suillus fuscotomentosus]